MTKKRKRSIDETFSSKFNTCYQQSMRKTKLHPEYYDTYARHTVPILREMVRKIGNKKWYSLRKPNLVSVVMVYKSACIIEKFFKMVLQKHRDSVLETNIMDGSRCPMTLDLIRDINRVNIFVHDGVAFSKKELFEYMIISVDFCNPITRKMMSYFDIVRLSLQNPSGDLNILDKYNNRIHLRNLELESIRDFSFWEIELDNLLIRLARLYYDQGTEAFNDAYLKFHNTWMEMRRICRNRTLVILMSLKQRADGFRGRPRKWANLFIESYYAKT